MSEFMSLNKDSSYSPILRAKGGGGSDMMVELVKSLRAFACSPV